MKTSLFFLIVFFISLSVWGENTCPSLSKLQKGDWFILQCTQHLPFSPISSEIENVMITSFRGEVTEKSGRKVQIAFYLKHLYLNWQQKIQSPQLSGNFQNYFDSYYHENTLPFNTPLMTLEVPLHKKNGITYTFNDTIYPFSYETIPIGIKTTVHKIKAAGSWVLNLPALTRQVILPFLEGRQTDTPEYDYSLTDASFPLTPNVHLTYIPLYPLAKDETKLTLETDNHPLELQADNSYRVTLFLPQPARGRIGKSNVQLMPGDSLVIRENGKDKFIFEGQGAADCYFHQEINKYYNFFFGYQNLWKLQTPQEINKTISQGRDIYQDLLSRYGDKMHPYWKQSAIRSLQYWEIKTHLRAYQMAQTSNSITPEQTAQYDIEWQQAPYCEVKPFTDYLYRPIQFDEFLQIYFQYKAQQLNADNLTNKFYWASNPDTYYLQKQIFSGYPQVRFLSQNLENMMEDEELSKIKREYDDFLTLCKNPQIANKIQQLWNQYMKIEPGANIKDAGLQITPLLPLRKKANGYILLSESFVFGDPQDLTTNPKIQQILKELKIADKTKLCYFRPESRQQFLPDSLKGKETYTFVQDHLIDADKARFNISPWGMIFMRNDGTILTRNLEKTEFGLDNLKLELQKAIQQPKIEKKFNKTEVYGFLIGFVVLFTLSFTIVFVRFKRIRLMRRLTELKLKAIRSQMNPHFIFNALGSIQALILQGKDEAANRYLTDFSKLLRTVLANSEKQLIPLSDEINLLRLYLKIEQLRTPLEFEILVDSSVNPEQEEIPGMLLQPIVENAVIHGIVPQGHGKIEIHFHLKDHVLYCEVCDNGPGLQSDETPPSQQKHFGIRSIENRLKLLNDTYHARIGILIEDRKKTENLKGCRVVISIPV